MSEKNHLKNEKVRICIIAISCFFLLLNNLLSFKFLIDTNLDTIFGYLVCTICFFCVYNGEISFTRLKHPLVALIALFAIILTIISIYHGVLGYIAYSVYYLLLVVFLLGINSKQQIELLLKGFCYAGVVVFTVFFVLSIMLSPLSGEQYASFTGNPNALGAHVALYLLCGIYLFVHLNGWKKTIMAILDGLMLGFIVFSRSRTALLMGLVTLSFMVFHYIINKPSKNTAKVVILQCIIMLGSIYISFFCITSLANSIDKNGLHNFKEFLNEKCIVDVLEERDTVNGNDNIVIQIENEDQNASNSIPFFDVVDAMIKRSLKGIIDSGSFSSGRSAIWYNFITSFNFLGHENSKLEIETFDGIKEYNAHNSYIQVTYNFGIFAGVLYIAITLYSFVKMCRYFLQNIKQRRQYPIQTFAMAIFANYLIYGLLASAVAPFSYIVVLMFDVITLPYMIIEE